MTICLQFDTLFIVLIGNEKQIEMGILIVVHLLLALDHLMRNIHIERFWVTHLCPVTIDSVSVI